MACFVSPPPMSNELDEMADHLVGSIHDLLMTDSELPLDSGCHQRGRCYPHEHSEAEHECIDPHKRHVTEVPNEENTSPVHMTHEHSEENSSPTHDGSG
jgi:hypothetical protein